MDVEHITSYRALQKDLDEAKHSLTQVNENIRRIVGRDHREITRSDKYEGNGPSKRMPQDKMLPQDNGNSTYNKRRNMDTKSVFNRLSALPPREVNETDTRPPRLNSRVIRELPTRQEILAAQCTDDESRARNKRMFGSLLGTLHKFCLEESRLKQREEKKAKVEKKLEEQAMLERENLRKERELLFSDRKRRQVEIRKLEMKMSVIKDYECWENAHKPLKYCIRSNAKPYIYYKPAAFNKTTEKLLAETNNYLKEERNKRTEQLKRELAEIEENFKLQEENNDQEPMDTDSLPHRSESLEELVEKRPIIKIEGENDDETIILNNIHDPINNGHEFKENTIIKIKEAPGHDCDDQKVNIKLVQ